MPIGLHFTYLEPTGPNLQQGDLLHRSDAIDQLLQEVHPHYYRDRSYRYFVVLTQSCDLVQTRINCRYITLAAARPATLVLDREIDRHRSDLERLADVCSKKKYPLVADFLRKLLNNNDTNYFYFHDEPNLSIDEPLCVFLRLSIAVRAVEHYQKCLDARVASLAEVFQAKLGWLVGNIYSRVGTPDWVPSVETSTELTKRIDSLLKEACKWEDDKRIAAAKEHAKVSGLPKSREDARALLRAQDIQTRRQKVLNSITEVLQSEELLKDAALSKRDIEIVKRALASHKTFKAATDG